MKAHIYIPTRGRPKVPTFWALPKKLRSRTTLVIRKDEQDLYKDVPCKKLVLPARVEGLSATRQWILKNTPHRYMIQIDDDFRSFNYKKDMDQWGLRIASEAEVLRMFAMIEHWLTSGFAHCGIMDRVRAAKPGTSMYQSNQLCAQFLAYDVKVLRTEKIRFDRVQLSQDKDVCLQLLELGYENRISRRFSYNNAPGDWDGGCSIYRTEKMRRDQSALLASLHPKGVIRRRVKPVKSKGVIINRAKNYVNWRLAFRSRINKRRGKQ